MSMSFLSTCKSTWETRNIRYELTSFYSFIFTLQEFAKELISLVDAIERIYCYERKLLLRDWWWMRFFTRVKRGFAVMFNIAGNNNNSLSIRKRLCMFIYARILGEIMLIG